MENSKVCKRCGTEKTLDEFNRNRSGPDGRQGWCRPCHNKKNAEQRLRNPGAHHRYQRAYKEKNRDSINLKNREANARLKAEFLLAYGGRCTCCGEREPYFLTVEHLNGDGKLHRAKVGVGYGQLRDLKRRGWPKDAYTILCMNCNWAERNGKPCPHKTKPKFIVVG